MDDVKISKFDQFRFNFLEKKISILNNDWFFPPTRHVSRNAVRKLQSRVTTKYDLNCDFYCWFKSLDLNHIHPVSGTSSPRLSRIKGP